MTAHHFLEENTGQVSVVRGPVVYCVESADLPDGVGIETVALRPAEGFIEEAGDGIFAGHVLLRTTAARLPRQSTYLYAELDTTPPTDLDVRLVPYALWANRGPGEMSVWLHLLH